MVISGLVSGVTTLRADLFLSHSQTVRTENWMFFDWRSAHRPSQTPEHFEALRSGRQHGENVCWADILRHTTRHDSQDPPSWLTVVCLDSVFSLEFPSVECFSKFYSSWFIPTDWSVRAEGENIMFYSNHYDSFKQWTPRLHCRCIPCLHPSPSPDWSDICLHSIQMPFVAQHQLTR